MYLDHLAKKHKGLKLKPFQVSLTCIVGLFYLYSRSITSRRRTRDSSTNPSRSSCVCIYSIIEYE